MDGEVGVGLRLQGTPREDLGHELCSLAGSPEIPKALASFCPPPKAGDSDIHDDVGQLASLQGC